jgi:quercetin dioxygenase-like cupin family protein
MKVMRIGDAKPYPAAKHFNMTGLRLQGFDATDAKNFWVGLSHFLPGGGAEKDGSPLEKVYVVVSGEVTVITDTGEATLKALDSCYLAGGEVRAVENRTNLPASMLVIMPYPPKS